MYFSCIVRELISPRPLKFHLEHVMSKVKRIVSPLLWFITSGTTARAGGTVERDGNDSGVIRHLRLDELTSSCSPRINRSCLDRRRKVAQVTSVVKSYGNGPGFCVNETTSNNSWHELVHVPAAAVSGRFSAIGAKPQPRSITHS